MTELRLEAGFSTHDILQAMLAHASIRAVQGSEVTPGENHKCDILPPSSAGEGPAGPGALLCRHEEHDSPSTQRSLAQAEQLEVTEEQQGLVGWGKLGCLVEDMGGKD